MKNNCDSYRERVIKIFYIYTVIRKSMIAQTGLYYFLFSCMKHPFFVRPKGACPPKKTGCFSTHLHTFHCNGVSRKKKKEKTVFHDSECSFILFRWRRKEKKFVLLM